MTWLKLAPVGTAMSEHDFRLLVQEHYLELFLPHAGSFDWDVAAFYRSEQPIYYFSPGAADLLLKFGKFPYEPCDRPESSAVASQVGATLASDTSGLTSLVRYIPARSSIGSLLTTKQVTGTTFWDQAGGGCGPLHNDPQHEKYLTRRE